MSEKKELPSLADLHKSPKEAFKNDQLNELLNQPVHDKWLKKHPMIPNYKYLPIDKVEFLLTRIYQNWKVEVLSVGQMFNAVYVTVRLHVQNPVTLEWLFHDGVGAVPVQTDKGESAADIAKIKSNAVTLALPAAKSYATKDAAENLGTLFGKDVGRKDTIAWQQGAYSKNEPDDLYSEERDNHHHINPYESTMNQDSYDL